MASGSIVKPTAIPTSGLPEASSLKSYGTRQDDSLVNVYRKYHDRLISVLLKRGINFHDAENAASDAWIRLLKKDNLNAMPTIISLGLLAKIAIGEHSGSRSRSDAMNYSEKSLSFDPLGDSMHPADALAGKELLESIFSLDGYDFRLIWMRAWEGMTFDQIGHKLGCSRESARNRVTKIMESLMHKHGLLTINASDDEIDQRSEV